MNLSNFIFTLDDTTYQAAQARAQQVGINLDQVLSDLLGTYAQGGSQRSTTYMVQRGDSLARIAKQVYGDPHKYPLIQQANKLTDPGRIWVGQVLLIPTLTAVTPTDPLPVDPVPTPPTPTPSPEPTSPSTPLSTQPSIVDYVRAMPTGFRADRAGGVNLTYYFQLNSGTFTLVIANGRATVSQGQSAPPTVVIGLSDADYIQLARGQFNAVQAYQQGRIQIGGDRMIAAKISDLFGPWASAVEQGRPVVPDPTPTPTPTPDPIPVPDPTPPPTPTPGGVNSAFLNGSFDDYQPYIRPERTQPEYWIDPQFPEEYGLHWTLEVMYEYERRLHVMNSGTFGRFTQRYFGGSGLDYHQHGRYSQVVTSRSAFDMVFHQTVAAQPGRTYTFKGMIVSFYKGTGGERKDGVVFKTIGIDPTGGQRWDSPSVVWGERDGKDNEWRYPSISVAAQGEAITVFIRLENMENDVGITELNIVHIENFTLE